MSGLKKKKVVFRVEALLYRYDGDEHKSAGQLAIQRMIDRLKGTTAEVEPTTSGSGMLSMIVITDARRIER